MTKKKKREQYVYPVDLTGIKEDLQNEAYKQDRSLHYWIKKILKAHLKQKETA